MTGQARLTVAGAGAFGTALAIALARAGRDVTLWGRNAPAGAALPGGVTPTDRLAPPPGGIVLLAIPAQALRGFLSDHGAGLAPCRLVSCAKGIEQGTGLRPTEIVAACLDGASAGVLTGPSFAADIAAGLPTALTLAHADTDAGAALQAALATPVLRLYRTDDVIGAELGGALKNVIAIAAGIVIGAGLGDSARAALMTRGYAELQRLALVLGARPETLGGLSGLGDLVLTCTSAQSRNFAFGRGLGAGRPPAPGPTVEGRATAGAVAALARQHGVEMPVTTMVAALIDGRIALADAVAALMARPLKAES